MPPSWTTSRCRFHQHFTRTFFVRKQISLVTFGFVIFLCLNFCEHKTLMKLTAGVDFINVLRAHFSYKKNYKAKTLLEKRLLDKKNGHKMLLKLTAGNFPVDFCQFFKCCKLVNFTNILRAAFFCQYSLAEKLQSQIIFREKVCFCAKKLLIEWWCNWHLLMILFLLIEWNGNEFLFGHRFHCIQW
jgi:hypothetical protein